MQEKLAITVLVITLALFALVMVLYNIVKEKGADYNQIVLSHQDYESRTLPYKRGNIVDRNGTYLATSEKVYNLILDPKQMLPDEENPSAQSYVYLEATLNALNECFGYDKDELRTLIKEKKDSYYVIYKKQLSADEKEAFEALQKKKNEEYKALPNEEGGLQRVGGVWFEEEYKRIYPYNEVASNVVGFMVKDGSGGNGGIEQYYNSTLTGNNGREYGYLNDDSNLERVVKAAENGKTIVSTIDINIQKICEKYIDEWQAGIGSEVAAVIVMDPNTSEVLAMASNSRYNLNEPYDLSAYYTEAEIGAMDEKTKANAWYKMWRNFCVSDTYEPGSPQKAFTVAGALEEGVVQANAGFECKGVLSIGGHDIHCVNRYGHGPISLTEGLMKSCNVVMMSVARMEGKEKFCEYQKLFGFGSKTGIDLPAEAEGLVYQVENMGASDLATNAFGQNYNCTMIQMAAAYCSLINGGSYYEPHVVKQILNDQGAVVEKVEPRLVRETVSESTSNYIKNALYLTVSGEGGTAGAAKVEGYEIGGKTGTAEKQPRADKNYLVSFAGFAPAYDPQVFCYVVLDTPRLVGKEQAHSTFASEVFSKIMGEVLPYMNVFPETDDGMQEDEELANREEGITSSEKTETGESRGETAETNESGELIPTETYPSFDEEFLFGEDSYPEKMPGQPEVTTPSGGTAAEGETTDDGTTPSGGGTTTTAAGDGKKNPSAQSSAAESSAAGN